MADQAQYSSAGGQTPGPRIKLNFGKASSVITPPAAPTPPSQATTMANDMPVDPMLDVINSELPPADPAILTMYGPILDRTVKLQYEALRDLLERQLPATPQHHRNKLVIEYAQNARVTLLKLQALLRWKNQADVDRIAEDGLRIGPVTSAVRLDAWIDDQHEHVRNLREHLSSMMTRTDELRIRSPDVLTALDVLSTGTYSGLPRSIDTWAESSVQQLTPTQKLEVLREMDAGLKSRMRLHEVLPERLGMVDIRDGKVYLRAEDLFECTLTANVSEWRNPWYLLDVKFLTSSIGSDTNNELPEAVKAGITQMVDPLLQYSPAEASTSNAPAKNTSLFKLNDVLEHLSLSYQLEGMFLQTVKLIRAEWTENLRVEMAQDRSSFRLSYWVRPAEEAQAPARLASAGPSRTAGSPHGGTITVDIGVDDAEGDPVQRALQSLSNGEESAPRKRLRTTWTASPDWLGFQDIAVPVMNENMNTIDIKQIVKQATKSHANALSAAIHGHMLTAIHASRHFQAEHLSFVKDEGGDHIKLELFGRRSIRIGINPVTGRLDIRESEAVVASVIDDRLKNAAGLVNPHVNRILDVILSLKLSFVMDALEEKMVYLGLAPARTLPVPLADFAEQGLVPSPTSRSTKPIMVVPLSASPEHYLLILVDPAGLRFAMVQLMIGLKQDPHQRSIAAFTWFDATPSLSTPGSGQPVAPEMLGRDLDAPPSVEIPTIQHDINASDLVRIYAYANAVIVMRMIEVQLTIATIPWRVAKPTSVRFTRPPTGVPAVYARIKESLGGMGKGEAFNSEAHIEIQDWREYRTPNIITSIPLSFGRTKLVDSTLPSHDGGGTSYDASAGVLTFSSRDLTGYVGDLLKSWSSLTAFVSIASSMSRLAAEPQLGLSLTSIKLDSLTVRYHEHWAVTIALSGTQGDLDLAFRTLPQGPPNPHQSMRQMLEDAFHELPQRPSLNKRFLTYLRATGECLGTIQSKIAGQANLNVCNPSMFLVICEKFGQRRAVEVEYVPNGSRFVIGDAKHSYSCPRYEQSIGQLQVISGLSGIFRHALEAQVDPSGDKSHILVDNMSRLICSARNITQTIGIIMDGFLVGPNPKGV